MITAERLRELLVYEPNTGVFTRRIQRQKFRAGSVAGSVKRSGHRHIRLDNAMYLAHRLVWLYVHGEWPPLALDHINGVPDDNRIANLRLATKSQNAANMKSHSRHGFKGARYHKKANRWQAVITVHGERKHLGMFATGEEASAAYALAARQYFGEFARLG